jgi:phage FluMu protein gp41
MKVKTIALLFFSLFFMLTSCSEESKNKTLKNIAKNIEADFPDKEAATQQIHQLASDYMATLNYDSLDFEDRYPLLSQRYLNKYQGLVNHALVSPKSVVQALTMSDQLQIFGVRELTTGDTLSMLSIKEILAKLDETSVFFGMDDATLENLLFYNQNEAVGGIKTTFSLAPVAFLRENGVWKIDPLGDPLHQKMKEQKLASMQQKSYDEYKAYMHEILEITEETWVPLKDRK